MGDLRLSAGEVFQGYGERVSEDCRRAFDGLAKAESFGEKGLRLIHGLSGERLARHRPI